MATKISTGFLKISTGRLTLACLVLFLIFSALILPDQAARAEVYSGEIGSPDTSLYYTASDLYRIAEAYGPAGRSAYIRARITFDLIWPLVYLAFLVTAISWLLKHTNLSWERWGRLNLLPVAGTIFDYLENISASIVMGRYPQTTPVIDHLAGVFTLFKWIFIVASFSLLLIIGGMALMRLIKASSKSTGQ